MILYIYIGQAEITLSHFIIFLFCFVLLRYFLLVTINFDKISNLQKSLRIDKGLL